MADFPALRTGAVAQYPLEKIVAFSTHTVRFLDGSRQRFRVYGSGFRRWVIKLSLLDEQELSALIAFAEQQGGDRFVFTDPLSGNSVANCILSDGQLEAILNNEMRGETTITIEETA